MDLLFSKYASPFSFVDGVIQTGRLSEFVDNFMECEEERQKWDFYLHKVFDKSFKDFHDSLQSAKPVHVSKGQLETTIQNSKSILNGFNPEGAGVNHGTI